MFTSVSFLPRMARTASVLGAAALLCGAASATENGVLRIANGWGGGELALPLLPGTNFTVGVLRYESTSPKDNSGNAPQVDLGGGMTASVSARANVTVTIPRLAWISEQKLWGGYIGAVALVPHLSQNLTIGMAGPPIAPVQAALDAQAVAMSGDGNGWGDLEIGPVLSWPGDKTNVTLALSMIFPTGQYDKARAVNAGSGDYKTFRPTLSVGYSADGWDMGTRVAVAFNERNKVTDVKSGTYLTADFSVLKAFGSVRAGVQGYLLQQLTNDDGPGVAADGNKGRAYALGPAISWLSQDGTWLVDVKWLKEFGVVNRPQGTASWISIAKQF